MPSLEPSWWYAPQVGLAARVLAPVAAIWGAVARRRIAHARPVRTALPLICIGNFTAGGTGKTPLAIDLAATLRAQGHVPAFLTRGYGANVRAPVRVDAERHTAADVGDEALLLAAAAPTVVSPDRAAGAAALADANLGLTVILMDDGLQNPSVVKDVALAVVDGRRGFGNGRVIPAGPLRAPLAFQLGLADALIVNGDRAEAAAVAVSVAPNFRGPILSAAVAPVGDTAWINGTRVIAYTGIGNPDRFYRTLERAGATVVSKRSFPDHHPFTDADAEALLAEAKGRDVHLVTTEKDAIRLHGHGGSRARLRAATRTLPVALSMAEQDKDRLMAMIAAKLAQRA